MQVECGMDVIKEFHTLVSITESAQAETKETKAKMEQLKDQYRRLQADFDNFRSRSGEEKAATGRNIKSSVIQDLLPLIDNFELAASQVRPFRQPLTPFQRPITAAAAYSLST